VSFLSFIRENKGIKMEKGTLYGVSIGPGDPELITVKAMNILSKSKYIATPHTGTGDSLAMNIVSQAVDLSDKEIMLLEFPMTKDKDILTKSHNEAADRVAKVLDSGEDVAMLNLGDVTIYSTFAYTMDKLLEKDYNVEVIPGVTSFCASASELKIGLTTMNEPLHIIPATGIDMKEALEMPGSKVFMKIGKSMPKLIETLKELDIKDNVYAVENCGLENQKVYNSLDEFDGKMGYFTIVVVK
jgi:precorrin-2/cobalt-factor-2 C20-methyltransferase